MNEMMHFVGEIVTYLWAAMFIYTTVTKDHGFVKLNAWRKRDDSKKGEMK